MAWKRNENEAPPGPQTRGASEPSPPANRPPARVGPSVTIRGDLTGEEDLLIEGQLEGEVVVRQHSVTVGPGGRLQADIYGQRIIIEGEVAGNLFGVEEIVVRKAGKVAGSAVSPRVTLESGAEFRGQIDMQSESVERAFSRREAGQSDSPPRSEARKAEAASPKSEPAAAPPKRAPTGGGAGQAAAGAKSRDRAAPR